MAHYLTIILLCFLTFTIPLWCETIENIGTYGPIFEIIEENMIDYLKNKLLTIEKEGGVETLQNQWIAKIQEGLKRPTPVQGLLKAKKSRSWTIDPTLVVENDIKNHEGEMLAQKGDRINPLHYAKNIPPLLLIDGDDEEQVIFATSQNKERNVDIVLVKGAPLDLQKDFKKPVYFDQGGYLSTYYQIKHIPVLIHYGKDVITVQEIVLS